MPGDAIPLGPFVLEAPIGGGGMGEVWRGRHAAQGVPVAIKVITADVARDPELQAAFRNEVRAVARLDHPGIVRVLEFGAVGSDAAERSGGRLVEGSPYLAMELLDGGVLDPSVPLDDFEALRATLLDLLAALAHAHARGVIHRDLKPANILYAGPDNDRPGLRITDFGIAHALESDEDVEGEGTTGTPWYMAPEQHHHAWRDFDPSTDLYAVGCIAWELICGRRPFAGQDLFSVVWGHLNTAPPPLDPRFDVPTGLDEWVRRLLEKSARARFRCAADAAFALRELEESLIFGAPPLPSSWRPPRTARRSPVRLGGAGLGLHGLRSLPVLGREEQLNDLWNNLHEVWATAGQRLILLEGAPGCGKSRIAEFVSERAEEVGGASALRVVHDPMPSRTTGLRGLVTTLLGCHGLNRIEVRYRVEDVLKPEGVDDAYEFEALTEFVSPRQEWVGSEADLPVRFLDPAQRNSLLQRLLRRRAAERPLVLWLDDVQWGGQAISLAEHILSSPPSATGPVLMLLTVSAPALAERPIEARRLDELMRLEHTHRLEVPPLGVEHCRQLVRDVLGLEGDLAAAVEARAGGNPLFVVQLVGDWVRRGLLRPGREGFRLKGKGHHPALVLPGDLNELWRDRIERVVEGTGGQVRETLELAAALGLRVDAFEWNHACGQAQLKADPSLIDTLLNDGLATESESGFAFASELLRDTLEQSARDAGRWQRWHLACVGMLRGRYADDASGLARRLGTHLLEGDSLDEAITHLGEAAWELVEVNEYREALQVVARREEALVRAAASKADPRWGECLLLRCGAKVHLGLLEDALEDARKAEVRGARYGWATVLARAVGQQGILARLGGDMDEAVERWEEALRLCPAEDRATRARVLFYLGSVRRQECDFAGAHTLYSEALELYGEAGSQLGEAQCLHGIGTIAQDTGDLDTAEQVFESLADLFRTMGNRFGLSQAINGLAAVAYLRGRLDDAEAGFCEAWDLLTSIGSPAAIVTGLNVALIHALRRDMNALSETLYRIERARAAAAQRPWLGQLLVYRLPVLADRRDWSGWDDALERAVELLGERAGAPQDIATVARLAGEVALDQGETGRAREAFLLARQQWELLDEEVGLTVIDGLLSRVPG
ncbi:MAG: protein kinase [Proteobacteria bacterium]|nr:protein kinase [Pseudomonadota bacterium]